MDWGVSGTQKGGTKPQLEAACDVLANGEERDKLRHGDCIGIDAEIHTIAEALRFWIIVHPPIIDTKRAFCQGAEILPPKDYLERNYDIVDASDVMLILPRASVREWRSGTWATCRYAEKIDKPTIIIWRTGIIEPSQSVIDQYGYLLP